MKRSIWLRLIAVILVISMVAAPVSAATDRQPSANTNSLIGTIIDIIRDVIRDIFDDWFDVPGDEPTEPEPTTAPTEPVVTEPAPSEPEDPTVPSEPESPTVPSQPEEPTVPSEPDEENETVLELVESYETVENGHLLRGVTYTLSQVIAQEPNTAPYALRGNTLTSAIGNRGNVYAVNATQSTRNGVTVELTNWVSGGQYYIQAVRAAYNSVNSWLKVNENQEIVSVAERSDATLFTVTINEDGTCYLSYDLNGVPMYLYYSAANDVNGEAFSTDPKPLTIEQFTPSSLTNGNTVLLKDDGNLMRIGYNGGYLNQHGGKTRTVFGPYNVANDNGNSLHFFHYENGNITQVTANIILPEMPETSTLVYFPVTMFNYDENDINPVTHRMEVEQVLEEYGEWPEDREWEGLHIGVGQPDASEYTYTGAPTAHTNLTWAQVQSGTYYSTEACNTTVSVEEIIENVTTTVPAGYEEATNLSNETIWNSRDESKSVKYGSPIKLTYFKTDYFYKSGSNYYPIYINRTEIGLVFYTVRYLNGSDLSDSISINSNTTLYTYNPATSTTTPTTTGYKLMAGGTVLARLNTTDTSAALNYTLYTPGTRTTISKEYAKWNHWGYKSETVPDKGAREQNMFYAGLVQNELDANGDIVFNIIEAGVFKTGTGDNIADKDVYEYVGLPFVLNDRGYYTFDSDENGVYFNGAPASGTADSFNLMTFDYGQPQGWAGMNTQFGDQSSNLWAPYNNNSNDTRDEIEYNFGMRADLPFSMTPNGRVKSTDDNSDPITFTFAGDDDVWIFIDGKLVIDLGGKHNRIGATIDFAANTITYFLPESNKKDLPLGCSNDPDFILVKQLFADTESVYPDNVEVDENPVISVSRTDFAAIREHSMSVFYMERGTGTSNCKIEFNLPMIDSVEVSKVANKSWSAQADKDDGDKGDGTSPLTDKEQAAVDKLDFGFTLYKKDAGSDTFAAVANANYYLMDAAGNILGIPSTDSNGHFYLKNGQTAKFITEIPMQGTTYYVVEDKTPNGFLTPDYQFKGEATYGFDWTDENGNTDHVTYASDIREQEIPMDAEVNQSYVITAKGSIEAADILKFICVNYLNADLPAPTALAMEDTIVIDYGLPVQIDPLRNDVFRGDDIEIIAIGDETMTLTKTTDENGFMTNYVITNGTMVGEDETPLERNFDFGTVKFVNKTYNDENLSNIVRDSFEYTLTKQLTEVEVISYVVKVGSTTTTNIDGQEFKKTEYDVALAKVYIVPATIMYYEEDFTGLITQLTSSGSFLGSVTEDNYTSAFQEPGVVGTVGDSTYGSDVAYLIDSHDSNGTSFQYDTTTGYVRFQYTFTGTGTSIFARTSATTGYMQVLLFNGVMSPDPETGSISHYSGKQESTYYRDTYFEDADQLFNTDRDTLYNIPVYTVDGLDYGTYTVLVTVAKAGTPGAGADGRSGNEFYLDGIRVMEPLDKYYNKELVSRALEAYNTDGESNLRVVTLRNKLITDVDENGVVWDEDHFVMLTDTNGVLLDTEEYVMFGPKEEVYLSGDWAKYDDEGNMIRKGQTVTFSLKYWQPQGLYLYMGMKAPFGNASINVGGKAYELCNAADCYYDVTNDYASLIVGTEQKTDNMGNKLFYDANETVYAKIENEDSYYFCDKDGNPVEVNEDELNPVMEEFYVVTYTFTATDSLVALTNIKVVGSHEFVIIKENNPNFNGSAGSDNSGDDFVEEEEQP